MKQEQLIDTFGIPLWESVIDFIKPFKKKTLFATPTDENSLDVMTGANLIDKTQQLGSALYNTLESQQKIILLFPQGLDYIYSLLACWYANLVIIPVPLGDLTKRDVLFETLDRIMADSQANCILTNTEFSQLIKESSNLASIHLLDINQLCHSDVKTKKERSKQPDELAILLYSSGSNSQPKGIEISYQSLVSQMNTSAEQCGISADSRITSWMPHFHNFGLNFNILAPLSKGAFSVILDAKHFLQQPNIWFDRIFQHEATHTAAPNFALDFCVNKVNIGSFQSSNQTPLASLKAIICGGEPLNQGSYVNFNKRFKCLGLNSNAITCHYGLSEAGCIVTSSIDSEQRFMSLDVESLEQNKVKPATQANKAKTVARCGKITGDTSVIIVEKGTLNPCDEGAIGEILVHSPSIASGYINKPEESSTTFCAKLKNNNQNFLRTGDLGFVDNECLYVVGREKDLIIINGKNHHPIDIESSIKRHVKYLDLTVMVFSQEIENEEKIIIVQEVNNGLSQNDYQSIVADIKHAVAQSHSIKAHEIRLVSENTIPRTGSGKVQKQACRNLHKTGALPTLYCDIAHQAMAQNHAYQATAPINEGLASIIETLKNKAFAPELNLTPSDLDSIDDFSTIMLDSIEYVIISKKIEEVFEFTFAPVMLFKYPSFTKLASYLHEELVSLGRSTAVPNDVNSSHKEHVNHHANSEPDDDLIAIIGMSGHFPGGATDLDLFWDNLINQTDCITAIPSDRQAFVREQKSQKASSSNTFPNWGGFLHDIDTFDAEFFGISPLEANSMDPQQRKVMEMTWNVFESAGHNPKQLADHNVGLFIGAHNNDYLELTLAQPELSEKYGAYLDSGVHMCMIANRASRWFDFNGPSEVINTACSSSLVAVHHAVESIKKGDCTVAVAGGINLILTPRVYKAAHSAGMLSTDGSCKTFDEQANGFVRAEGYGAVLLKPYKQAKKDNDSIYGVIRSAVINHDGKSNSLRAPNLDSQAQLIQSAYQSADIAPESVSYIETHGTGTPLGDPIEIEALKEAFNAMSGTLPHQYCGLGTVKTNIGHCESAAGIAGLIKVLLSMKHQTLPSMLHFNQLNPAISLQKSPFYVVDKNQPWQHLTGVDGESIPLRAGISSFGFGGMNAHLVVEEPTADELDPTRENTEDDSSNGETQLILLSAKTAERLQVVASRLYHHLMRHSSNSASGKLSNIAYTLQVGRHAMQERLAMIVDTPSKLMDMLHQFLSGTLSEHNVYRGTANKELELLNGDSDEGLKTALNHSSEVKELHKIGSFWVRGVTPYSWQSLHRNTRPKRINLPSYPFAENRYWLPDLPQHDKTSSDVLTTSGSNCASPETSSSIINDDDILLNVKRAVCDNTELAIQNIDKSANLSELGVDSIIRLKLANQIIKMYPDCSLDHNELLLSQNINEIVLLIQEKTGKTSVIAADKDIDMPPPEMNDSAATNLSLKIKEMISHHTGHSIDMLDPSCDLSALGVDSITRLKLTNDIVKVFPELSFEHSQVLVLPTINDITALLQKAFTPADSQNAQEITTLSDSDEKTNSTMQEITRNIKEQACNIMIENVKPCENDSNALQAEIIVCEDHDFFNDHLLDHITGVQLIESMMQLIKASELRNTNMSSYYTKALTINFNAFCEHDSSELFCTEVSNDTETQSKSFTTRVRQHEKNICQASVTIQNFLPSTTAPRFHSVLPDDVSPCIRSMVNKRNNDNVFISSPSTAWEQSGVWFLPNHSETIFTDNTAGFIDVTHLIEGCRQHQRSLTKRSLSQNAAEGNDQEQKAISEKGIGILKSLEIRLSRALRRDESIFISNGDMNVLDVGGNHVINWQSDLLVNGEVVGSYKMEALILSRDVYRTWRSVESDQIKG